LRSPATINTQGSVRNRLALGTWPAAFSHHAEGIPFILLVRLGAYRKAYQNTNNAAKMIYPVTVRGLGYNSCFGDTLYQSNDPDPNTGYNIQDNPVDFTQ
jgi:hypothetical protein